MSRDELLDVLHEQVSELSDAQLERLVKAMKHTCFRLLYPLLTGYRS
jgi:hypothetical protein